MLGAIIGDVVGSVYEWHNIKTKEFELFDTFSTFTDDTVMTVAVAKALCAVLETYDTDKFKEELVLQMQAFGRKYSGRGYGGKFAQWLKSADPKPYNSFGNGSAMRVSACGYLAANIEQALEFAKTSAEVTHNHPEGIKGAQATAAAIFLAKCGKPKAEIKRYIEENFYKLDKTLAEIRPTYRFDVTCQGSVPQAIQAFLESTDFEDAIRNAISIGGDSDTIAAIAGSIAWAYYRDFDRPLQGNMRELQKKVYDYLPQEFIDIYEKTDLMRAKAESAITAFVD